ncbi:MAG: hypothetical protein MUE98_00020 [Rhodobacteraceae bacterium]|jgi:hypothetical protein|nr:hypothetical protein [Paracoccaceae bacterium]
MNPNAWKEYAADFIAISDAEIEREKDRAAELIAEQEQWLEAIASWEAAGKPRRE